MVPGRHVKCPSKDPNRASSFPIYDQQSLLKQLILNHQSLILNKLFYHFMVSWQVIFQNWDRDGSGDISVAELTRVLKRLCLGRRPDPAAGLIRRWSRTENIRKLEIPRWRSNSYGNQLWFPESMDWFKGKSTGKPHIEWENLWFPVNFPLNQSNHGNDVNHHPFEDIFWRCPPAYTYSMDILLLQILSMCFRPLYA